MTSFADRLSVVLLTHNRAQEALRLLQNLLVVPVPPQVIVVDNASSDGTGKLIRQNSPRSGLL